MQANFEDFGMIKSTFQLSKDQKSFAITKYRSITTIDKELREVINHEESSRKVYRISDIKSVIFGPMQSRLWMFRKAINMIPRSEMDEMKFFSWQCITLQLDS